MVKGYLINKCLYVFLYKVFYGFKLRIGFEKERDWGLIWYSFDFESVNNVEIILK